MTFIRSAKALRAMAKMPSFQAASSTSFNPIHQNVTFFAADGVTPITVSIAQIDAWRNLLLTSSIAFSIQIGAALLMLVVVLLVTPAQKRNTPIFILNCAALLISAISNILIVAYYPSEMAEFWTWFSSDDSLVSRSTLATSIAADTFGPLYLGVIELSLLFQTDVICATMGNKQRWSIKIAGFLAAATAIGFNFTQMVMNNIATLNASYYSNPNWNWVVRAVDASYTLSIWYFCIVFVSKLVKTMITRKKMGMKLYGPMKIICIMGGCTMIIPSIFSILEFDSLKLTWEPGPIGHTLVAIMLPLSSLWAATPTEGQMSSAHNPAGRRKPFFSDYDTTLASNNLPLNSYHNTSIGDRKASAGVVAAASSFEPASTYIKGGVFSSLGLSETECGTGAPRENNQLQGSHKSKSYSAILSILGGHHGGRDAEEGLGLEVERRYSVHSSRGLSGVDGLDQE